MAPLSEEWKKMLKMVEQFYNRPDAEPFRSPVPWKEMGLVDYPKLIKQPMDLGTVKTKIQKGQYNAKTVGAAIELAHQDVIRVWKNCMTYNADGSDFYKLAASLEKKYQDKYKKVMASVISGSGSGGSAAGTMASGGNNSSSAAAMDTTSASDRKSFAKALFTIEKEDLGKVLMQAEAKCPNALLRNATEDEVELNVDLLTPEVLKDLTAFVNEVKKGKNSKASSAAAAGAKKRKK